MEGVMRGALCLPLNPPLFNSVCLGLFPGHIDSPYLVIMSWITIPRDEYYTTNAMKRSYFSLFWQQGSNKQADLDLDSSIGGLFVPHCHANEGWRREPETEVA